MQFGIVSINPVIYIICNFFIDIKFILAIIALVMECDYCNVAYKKFEATIMWFEGLKSTIW